MKRFLMPLLAALLLVGCGGGGSDDPLSVTDLAGTYTLTQMTGTSSGTTVTLTPPAVSGTLTLTTGGAYTLDLALQDEQISDRGSFSVSEPAITFVSADGSWISGTVSGDGRTITFTGTEGDTTVTLEFAKS